MTLNLVHRSDWEENCVADARQVRVLGVCWGAAKIPKRLEVLVPRVNPTGLDGWEKIKVAHHHDLDFDFIKQGGQNPDFFVTVSVATTKKLKFKIFIM